MRLIVISPESADRREVPAMEGFFGAGLERYHVRKPSWTAADLEAWLVALPAAWRPKLVLHQHHGLVAKLGLGGAHERDVGQPRSGTAVSRSCHSLGGLQASLGLHESVIFGPVFPSMTKAGYGPAVDFPWDQLAVILGSRARTLATQVIAIGGVDLQNLERCRDLGFDGAAVLGAVWSKEDPARAFAALLGAAQRLEATRHAA
jgi:thiamine-phosphate pyrophosphorylase